MKIVHVIPSLAPCHGGPSVVLPIMERALSREGIEVTTVTTDDDGPGRRNDKGDGSERNENGVSRRYFPKQTEFYKVSLPLARWIKRHVREFDAVHIHALFSHTSVAAGRAAVAAGVPCIIRPLGVLNRYGVTQRRALLKRFCLKWIDGPLVRKADAVHFTLEDEWKEAEALGLSFKGKVVPLGLEPVGFAGDYVSTQNRILFLSRIDPKKNIEGLLDAWARVAPSRPEWRLTIAGAGAPAYVETLIARACRLGIADRTDWPGHVTGTEKTHCLAEASIFVLPSHSENFGIAAAEAMMVGKACVFSPGVAVGAAAVRAGAAFLGGPDPDSLAVALTALMDEPSKCEELGHAALRFAARELSADVMAQRLKMMYEEVIAAHCS